MPFACSHAVSPAGPPTSGSSASAAVLSLLPTADVSNWRTVKRIAWPWKCSAIALRPWRRSARVIVTVRSSDSSP
jgi:hypothetical protein